MSWINRATKALEDRKDLFDAIQKIVTVVALVIGGVWTYVLTSQYRETAPKLAIKQDVSSWTLLDGMTLVRVNSIVTNTGKVKIDGVSGRMIVWRLLPETKEQSAAYTAGQIWFNCKDNLGEPFPNCVPEQGLNLPLTSKKLFEIKDLKGSLEPGESLPYWRYLLFDGDVTTLEVYTLIEKPGAQEGDWIFDSTFDLQAPNLSQRLEPPQTQQNVPAKSTSSRMRKK